RIETLERAPAPGGDSAGGRLVVCERGPHDVAQRAHQLDVGTPGSLGGVVLESRAQGSAAGGLPPGAGASGPGAGAGPVVRLAIHDLPRRRARLRRETFQAPL